MQYCMYSYILRGSYQKTLLNLDYIEKHHSKRKNMVIIAFDIKG